VSVLRKLLSWVNPHQRKPNLNDPQPGADVIRRLRELQEAARLIPEQPESRKAPRTETAARPEHSKDGTWD
jgi:hypothetical protein